MVSEIKQETVTAWIESPNYACCHFLPIAYPDHGKIDDSYLEMKAKL